MIHINLKYYYVNVLCADMFKNEKCIDLVNKVLFWEETLKTLKT